MKIIINLGRGNLNSGCDNVVVQLLDSDRHYVRQFSGSLPPAPELAELYHRWQSEYRAFYQDETMRIGLLESEGIRYSAADFSKICSQISARLNLWLSSDDWIPIEKALRTNINENEPLQIIVTSNNREIQQLPWHLWNFVEDYPLAEIVYSSPSWQKISPSVITRPQVRILVVLGNSTGIDVRSDLKSLDALPKSEIVVLIEPQLIQLNEYLWQPQGWDILLFSGHSHSDTEAGYIYLNATEKITIARLKHSLTKAIAFGLQIAIFNSCEGIGLASQLADLSLPHTIVMSEPVPDRIARVFLQYFLNAFVAGKTFTLAVKEARQRLAGWESEYPCASWLPVVWQNPATDYLTWQDLQPTPVKKSRRTFEIAAITSITVSSLVMVCRWLNWFQPAELWAYDRLTRQRTAETIDPRILVVEITEDDTNSDRYPISDTILVETLDLLEQHQPAAIGLDIHRSYERGTGYQELVERFQSNSHLFPVCAYSATNKSYAPPKGLSETKLREQMGFSDLSVDDFKGKNSDSGLTAGELQDRPGLKVRRQLLSYDPNLSATPSLCLTPYSLSFQLAFEYLQKSGVEPLTVNSQQQWQFGQVTFNELERRFAGYQQLNNSSQIMLNYRSAKPGKQITLTQLRSGQIDPQLIEDRIVLIGYTASVARDYFDTPYGTMPGVWIHAHMTSQLISAVEDGRSLIRALPQWGDWLLVLCLTLLSGMVWALLAKKPTIYTVLSAIILIAVLDRLFLLLLIKGVWLPYVPTMVALLTLAAALIVYQRAKLSHN